MPIIPVLCLIGVTLITACAPDPKTLGTDYVSDSKYDTQDCIDQRQKALAHDDNTLSPMNRMALILFIPFGIPIVAESDFTQKEERKTESNPSGVAVSTIRKMQFMLKGALSDGVKQKKLDANPLADAIVAETDDVDYAPHSFSISDAQTVLETIYALEDRRWTMFFVLGLRTGLRKGEIAALQWSDFTFGENVSFLEVKRAVDWSKGDNKPFLKSPKTKKSKRQIVLTNDTAHELKLYRAWQSQKWMECGQELNEDALLFFNDNFGLVSKSVPQHRWDKVIKKSGVKKLTLHKLRHTFATYLWKQSKDLSLVGKMLGHSNEKTTQIYVDKIDEMEKEAEQLQQVENLFKRGAPGGTKAQHS